MNFTVEEKLLTTLTLCSRCLNNEEKALNVSEVKDHGAYGIQTKPYFIFH